MFINGGKNHLYDHVMGDDKAIEYNIGKMKVYQGMPSVYPGKGGTGRVITGIPDFFIKYKAVALIPEKAPPFPTQCSAKGEGVGAGNIERYLHINNNLQEGGFNITPKIKIVLYFITFIDGGGTTLENTTNNTFYTNKSMYKIENWNGKGEGVGCKKDEGGGFGCLRGDNPPLPGFTVNTDAKLNNIIIDGESGRVRDVYKATIEEDITTTIKGFKHAVIFIVAAEHDGWLSPS